MRHCDYAKPNGDFCGSPALRGRDYCYWHITCVARRLRAEKQEATCSPEPLELPPLEDANSVQLALMMVMDAMLRKRISPKMSGQLLYALQIASSNLKQGVCFQSGGKTAGEQREPKVVTQCSRYDSLEADYDIAEHDEQLKAADEEVRFEGAEPVPEDQAEAKPPEELSPEDQKKREALEFLRAKYGQDFDEPFYYPGEDELGPWRRGKQREAEGRKLHWDNLRRDLAEAAKIDDLEALKDLVADCYQRTGLQYEADGWKPAGPQKVLFGVRKLPAGVQQQWYEQRKANCSAEFDKLALKEAAAAKKIS